MASAHEARCGSDRNSVTSNARVKGSSTTPKCPPALAGFVLACALITQSGCGPQRSASTNNGGIDALDDSGVPPRSGPAQIDPIAVARYSRTGDPDIYKKWGAARIPHLNAFRKAAAETVAKNPTCGRVSYADLADEEHGSVVPNHPVMIVDCMPIQRFFVAEQDLNRNVASENEKGRLFTRKSAIDLCLKGTREKLSYPSTMSIDPLSISADQGIGTGNWGVTVNFEAKNGIGNRVPQVAHCVLTPGGNLEVHID